MTQQTGMPESPLFGPTMPFAQQAPPPMPPMPQGMPEASVTPGLPGPPLPPQGQDWKAQLPMLLTALAGLAGAGNNPFGAAAYMRGFQDTQQDQAALAQRKAEQAAIAERLKHEDEIQQQVRQERRDQLELERQKFVATATENILKNGNAYENDEDRKNYLLGMQRVMSPLGVDTGKMVSIPVPGGAKKLQEEAKVAVTGAMDFLSKQGKEVNADTLNNVTVKVRGKDVPFIEAAAMAGMPMATADMPNKDKSANLTLGDYYNEMVAGKEGELGRKLLPGERVMAMKEAKRDWEKLGWKPTVVNAGGQVDMDAVAEEVVAGRQDPTTVGLYRYSAAFKTALAKRHFNLAKANQEWYAVKRFLSSANGPQQLRVRQNLGTLTESLPLVRQLVSEWKAGGLQVLNRGRLELAKQGVLGQAAQSLAVRLDQQLSDVTAELAGVLMGGNSPTDPAFKLAQASFSSNWSEKTLLDAVDQAEKNANFRKNAIENTGPAGIDPSMHYGETLDPTASTPTVTAPSVDIGQFSVKEVAP